jgi:hypothetical protein
MQDVTHRFAVPNRIITDLGTTFTGSAFWDFCQDNTIDIYYSIAQAWCNGQVERAVAWFFKLSKIVFSMTLQTTLPGG